MECLGSVDSIGTTAARLPGTVIKYVSIIFRTRVANVTTIEWTLFFCSCIMPADCRDPEWAIDLDLIYYTENTL